MSELTDRLRRMDGYIQAQHKAAGSGTCGQAADRIDYLEWVLFSAWKIASDLEEQLEAEVDR